MDKKKIDRSKLGRSNKQKGQAKERNVARNFRELGYEFAKTSRQASRLLDDSKVDIAFIPYNIQCKKGYPKGVNYTLVMQEMKEGLKNNFPLSNEVHNNPCIIIHDKGRRDEDKLVVMEEKFFWEIVKKLKELEDLNEKL